MSPQKKKAKSKKTETQKGPAAPSKELLLKAALEAAHEAGKILMGHFKKQLFVREKPDEGLVTQIDLKSEKKIIEILCRYTPYFSFVAEETAPDPNEVSPEGNWIIDPLDGTTNYIHGFPFFCVSIGAHVNGKVVAGVIHHPPMGETYYATRGGGAFLLRKIGNKVVKEKLKVSKTMQLRDSLLTTGFTYRKKRWLHTEMEAFERLSTVVRAIRRPGSAALDLAYTARGIFDGFWERGLSSWDVTAGSLIVEEAGGKVSDFKGDAFDVYGKEILASNSRLHGALSAAIAPESCPIIAENDDF